MAGVGGPAAERLRGFLRDLKPGARALLIAELERGLLNGNGVAGAELVLAELRRSLRHNQSKTARFDAPARLFFQPLEPFLVDDVPEHKHRARIARSALEPLWLWINNTLLPEDAAVYVEEVEQVLLAGDTEMAEKCSHAFQDRVVERISQLLEEGSDKGRRRLSVQLGTTRALDDGRALHGILRTRDALALLGTQLPGHIASLSGPMLDGIKGHLDTQFAEKSGQLIYSLV